VIAIAAFAAPVAIWLLLLRQIASAAISFAQMPPELRSAALMLYGLYNAITEKLAT
jgi:hypothetical protein